MPYIMELLDLYKSEYYPRTKRDGWMEYVCLDSLKAFDIALDKGQIEMEK